MAARRVASGGGGRRRRAVHRARRLRRLPHRLPTSGSVALRRRVRTPGRGDAAQRPEGPRGVAHLAPQGRHHPSWPRVLREARPRQGDVHRAADGAVLPRALGCAAGRRASSPQPERTGRPEGAARGMGNGDVGPADRREDQGPGRLHPRDGRTAGRDDRDPRRGRVRAEVHLHLDAGDQPVSRTRCAAGSAARPRCARSPGASCRARA